MRHSIWLALAFIAVTFSGCVSGDDADSGDGAQDVVELGVLGPHKIPTFDGPATVTWLADYAATYPLRITGTPVEEMAAAHIVAALADAGYTVDVLELAPFVPTSPAKNLRAIIATIPGQTMPDNWLAWGGHYDTAVSTIEGAYDNGSGTALAIELARGLAAEETNRTKAVILFNGEEEGLLASRAFMEYYKAQNEFVIDLFVGFDMVGIAYPCDAPLAYFSAAAHDPDFVELARAIAIDELGLPDDNESVTFSPRNTRNSDEAAFASEGIPSMRFAGMQTAGDYSGYHRPDDTMETIYNHCGGGATGQENFAEGLANTMRFASGMLLALDHSGVPEPSG